LFRVTLSLQDIRTTSDALKRSGMFALASEGTSERGWRRSAHRAHLVLSAVASAPEGAFRSFSIFGGCLASDPANCRMFSAPLTLDPSATQEGGP
jgi:hypothetical protein